MDQDGQGDGMPGGSEEEDINHSWLLKPVSRPCIAFSPLNLVLGNRGAQRLA